MSAKNTYLTRAGARDLTKRIWNRKFLYLLFLPVALNFILFHYWPMAGLQIAFKRYNIVLGLGRSAVVFAPRSFGSTAYEALYGNDFM